MPQKFVDYFLVIDSKVTVLISSFLKPYGLNTVQKDLVYTIPVFIKIAVYLLILLTLLVILKMFHRHNRIIHFLLMFTIFLIAMSIFGVFLGFFQLLYS